MQHFAYSLVKQRQRQFFFKDFRRPVSLKVALIRRADGKVSGADEDIFGSRIFDFKAGQKKPRAHQTDDLLNHDVVLSAKTLQCSGRILW